MLLAIAELVIVLPFIRYQKEKESKNAAKFKENVIKKRKEI